MGNKTKKDAKNNTLLMNKQTKRQKLSMLTVFNFFSANAIPGFGVALQTMHIFDTLKFPSFKNLMMGTPVCYLLLPPREVINRGNEQGFTSRGKID